MPSHARTTLDLHTTCACGAVDIRIAGRVVSMLHCACLDCQKATGTGHSAVVLVPTGALTVAGISKSFARPSDSGAQFTRHFCPCCGTPLFGQSSRALDIRMVPVGLFAGDTAWFTPGQLIFARSRQAWDLFADHLPQHDRYRDSQP